MAHSASRARGAKLMLRDNASIADLLLPEQRIAVLPEVRAAAGHRASAMLPLRTGGHTECQ